MDTIRNDLQNACEFPDIALAICAICNLKSSLSLKDIFSLLNIPDARAEEIQNYLSSNFKRLNFTDPNFHDSFKLMVKYVDFETNEFELELVECCLQVLYEHLRFNLPDVDEKYLHAFHSDIPDFFEIIDSIPIHVRYAAVYVAEHLKTVMSSKNVSRLEKIHQNVFKIIPEKLLYWMELLCLLGQTSRAIETVTTITSFLEIAKSFIGTSDSLIPLLIDTQSVIERFHYPISKCAFQVYWTAISFSSPNSLFYQQFNNRRPPGMYPRLLPKSMEKKYLNLHGHKNEVVSVVFSDDGDRVITGSWDTTIKIWDAYTGLEIRTLKGHRNLVLCVDINKSGDRIASGSADNAVKIWDAHTGSVLYTLTGHRNFVEAVAFDYDGSRIASGSWDEKICVWDTREGVKLGTYICDGPGHIYSVAFSKDGNRLVSGNTNTIYVWHHIRTARSIKVLNGHVGAVRAVSFTDDGNKIISCADDRTIKIWSLEESCVEKTMSGHTARVVGVVMGRNGKLIYSGSADNTVKVWDSDSGEILREYTPHSHQVRSIAVNYLETKIVCGFVDGTVIIWDAIGADPFAKEKFEENDDFFLDRSGWIFKNGASLFWIPPELRGFKVGGTVDKIQMFSEQMEVDFEIDVTEFRSLQTSMLILDEEESIKYGEAISVMNSKNEKKRLFGNLKLFGKHFFRVTE